MYGSDMCCHAWRAHAPQGKRGKHTDVSCTQAHRGVAMFWHVCWRHSKYQALFTAKLHECTDHGDTHHVDKQAACFPYLWYDSPVNSPVAAASARQTRSAAYCTGEQEHLVPAKQHKPIKSRPV